MQRVYEHDDRWLGLLCTLHISVQGFCVLSVTLCWEFDSKNWEHSNSLFGKRISLGCLKGRSPFSLRMKRKSKLILMRKGGSSPVGDLVPTQRRTPKDFCFMQEKPLEPKEALEDESGVQGLDEIEEWGHRRQSQNHIGRCNAK